MDEVNSAPGNTKTFMLSILLILKLVISEFVCIFTSTIRPFYL